MDFPADSSFFLGSGISANSNEYGFEKEDDLDFEALLNLPIEALMEIEVTGATMTSESLLTVPSSVTIFTHQQMDALGIDKLHELFNYVPGFQSYVGSSWAHNHTTSVRGRKIATRLAEVLLLVDGQRLNNPRTGGAAVVVPTFPISQIERVEFIRGPGASLYGSNAMMGVVNIITRRTTNEITLGYGTHARKTIDAALHPHHSDFNFQLLAHYDADNGDRYDVLSNDTLSPVELSDEKGFKNLIMSLDWDSTSFNLQYYESVSKGYFLEGATPNEDSWSRHDLFSVQVGQAYNWYDIDSKLTLEYQRGNIELDGIFQEPDQLTAISNPPSDAEVSLNVNFKEVEGYRAFWLNDWQINTDQDVQFGAEYRYQTAPNATARGNFDIGALANQEFPIRSSESRSITTVVQDGSRRDILGFFGQFQQRFLESTHLTLGLRYDRYASIGSEISPRVSFIHSLNSIHAFKLLYGKAFRAPSENELFLTNNTLILGNPNLKPETVTTWEAIWLAQWQHSYLSLGYFENHFQDSIVLTPTAGARQEYQNHKLDDTKGIELEFHHYLPDQWSGRISLMQLIENAGLSFKEADTMGSVSLNYQFQQWTSNISAVYHGSREAEINDGNDRIKLNDYWLVNGKVGYQWTDHWHSHIQIKNLLDKDYNSPNQNIAMPNPIPNRGRELLASITFHF